MNEHMNECCNNSNVLSIFLVTLYIIIVYNFKIEYNSLLCKITGNLFHYPFLSFCSDFLFILSFSLFPFFLDIYLSFTWHISLSYIPSFFLFSGLCILYIYLFSAFSFLSPFFQYSIISISLFNSIFSHSLFLLSVHLFFFFLSSSLCFSWLARLRWLLHEHEHVRLDVRHVLRPLLDLP